MTANDVFRMAMKRLNYTDEDCSVNTESNGGISMRALDSVNYILSDLAHIIGRNFEPIHSLQDELPVDDDIAVRVMPWGVGMMLAQSESDGDNQAYFATMYNGLRNSFHRCGDRVMDVIPKPF